MKTTTTQLQQGRQKRNISYSIQIEEEKESNAETSMPALKNGANNSMIGLVSHQDN